MSLVAGLRSGIRSGLRSGLNPADAGLASVTRDAGNLQYYPANASEWDTLLSVAGLSGGPSSVWLAQEAAGSLADSIDAVTLSGVGTAPLYQQAITGASRLGVRWTDNLVASHLSNLTTAPNPATTSLLLLAYLDFPVAPGGNREIIRTAASNSTTRWIATGVLRLTAVVSTDGLVSTASTQGWVAMRTNITAGTVTVFSSAEKIVGTYGLPAAGAFTAIGGLGSNTAAIGYAYVCLFSGTGAEKTDAQVKTMMQTLGATVLWS